MNNPDNFEENGQKSSGRSTGKPEPSFESWWMTGISQVNESINDLNREVGEIQGKIDHIPQMNKDLQEIRDSVRDMLSSEKAVNDYKEAVRGSREYTLKMVKWGVSLFLGLIGISGAVYTILNVFGKNIGG